MDNNHSLTLQQYQQLLTNTIQSNPNLRDCWVTAELSDVRVSGGHCYMELVEKNEAGGMRAKMRAVIWSSIFMRLRSKFYAATGRDITSGIKLMVRGSATNHSIYGFSFVISDIDPTYTLGDMDRIRREILDRLAREGVINFNKELPVPALLQRVAVISAAGAAGYGDFMNQLGANVDGFQIYPMLFPAVMQGDRTVPTVMEQLDKVEATIDCWDCVVIIRGGGATTDLNAFDNYDLAHRVATFPLPVIVGIGHERDRTVLDELAAVRCKTPTAVAAFLLDRMRDSYSHVIDMMNRISRYDRDALRGEHLRLSNYEQSIPALVSQRVLRARMRLQEVSTGIERAVARRLRGEDSRMERYEMRLQSATAAASKREQHRLERLESMLRVLSPENTLKRGYSITRVNGKSLRTPEQVADDDVIETMLADGVIFSKKLRTEN
jgi:exodeoxyribonuclease VII large subunit